MIDTVTLSQLMPGRDISYPSETSNENLFKECLNSLDGQENSVNQVSVNSQGVALTPFDSFINFSSEEAALEQDQDNDLLFDLPVMVAPISNPILPEIQVSGVETEEGDAFEETLDAKSQDKSLNSDAFQSSEDFANFSEIAEHTEDLPLTALEKSLVEKAQASLQVLGNEGSKITNDRSMDRARPQPVGARSSSPTISKDKIESAPAPEVSETPQLLSEETLEDFDLSLDLSFEKNSDSDQDIKGMTTVHTPLNTPTTATASSKAALAPQAIVTPAKQVEVQIRHGLENGLQKLAFELTPGDLGRVQVQLEIDAQGHVSARVQTENLETFDMLQQDSSTREIILQAFEDAGLKTDENSLQFSYADSSAQHTFTEQTLQQHQIYEDATENEDSPIQYHPRVDATRMYDILA